MNAPVKNLRNPGYPIDDQFRARWSPRAFADAAMTEADVLTLIEAARWAPSANNLQPWRFVYGLRGDAGFAAIAEALVPFNRMWAEKAAALIVVASKTTTSKDGVDVPNSLHAFDTGTA
jgi:nitroreductase